MIVVKYQEKIYNAATSTLTYAALGTETYDQIEEVLLPVPPSATAPIFITKKFSGHTEYRWSVEQVESAPTATPLTYNVTLLRRKQVDKGEYLSNILRLPGNTLKNVLYPYALVEVEYGHSPNVGKESGAIRNNRRYPDTLQWGSMPKRRLAIVNQLISRQNQELVQVIPISSRHPAPGDISVVDLDNQLNDLVHYSHKQSWAICSMIETVSPRRIIAPMVRYSATNESRDTGFSHNISKAHRPALKDALMHGIASSYRVNQATQLASATAQVTALTQKVTGLEAKAQLVEMYERMEAEYAESTGSTVDEVRSLTESPAN